MYSHDLSKVPCKFFHLYASCTKDPCPFSHDLMTKAEEAAFREEHTQTTRRQETTNQQSLQQTKLENMDFHDPFAGTSASLPASNLPALPTQREPQESPGIQTVQAPSQKPADSRPTSRTIYIKAGLPSLKTSEESVPGIYQPHPASGMDDDLSMEAGEQAAKTQTEKSVNDGATALMSVLAQSIDFTL